MERRPTRPGRDRLVVLLVSGSLASVLAASLVAVPFLRPPEPVSVDDALIQFRESQPDPAVGNSAEADESVLPVAPAQPPPQPSAGTAPPASATEAAPSAPAGPAPAPAAPGEPPRAAPPPPRPGPATTSNGTEPAPPPSKRSTGVYTYDTSGHEQVDVLGGERHDYPRRTAITVRDVGCGQTETWRPVDGRLSELETCPTPQGQNLRRLESRQRFFGQSQARAYRCPNASVVQPAKPANQSSSRFTCQDAGSAIELTVTVADADATIDVNGQAVPCVQLEISAKLTGEASGTTRDRRWLTSDGTLLRWESQTDVTTTTDAGRAQYTERLVMQLTNLEPQK